MGRTSFDICLNNYIHTAEPLLTFNVEGDFLPYISATKDEPSEGGYLEDITITFLDKDVTEITNDLYIRNHDKYISLYDLLTDIADALACENDEDVNYYED